MRATGLLLLVIVLAPGESGAAGRLIVEDRVVTVDQPVWICARGAPRPDVLEIEGREGAGARLAGDPGTWKEVRIRVNWPAHGPLALHAALPPRPRAWALPGWGNRGSLAPGRYVLRAEGFRAESLTVRVPDAGELRARGLLARAWRHAAEGDSVFAARLVESLLDLEPGNPYEEEAFLLLMDLLPHTRYRDRPKDWLSEWVALHHSHCIVGEGIRRWLDQVDEEEARSTLAELVSGYPQSRAAAAAREWLRAGPDR